MTNFFFTALLVLTTICQADFNPRTGSYHGRWQELDFLVRVYDSRNLFSGYFGFGWCSNLEMQLERKWNSILVLHSCQTAQDLILNPLSKNSWVGQNGLKAEQIGSHINIDLKEFGLLGFPVKGGFPNSIGKLHLNRKDSGDLLITKNGKLKFKIHFNDNNRKITSVMNKDLVLINYNFKFDDLISVTSLVDSKSKGLITYSYDSTHNLLVSKNSRQQTEFMSYDEENDRLINYKNSTGINLSMTYYSKGTEAFETTLTDNNKPNHTQIFKYSILPTLTQRLGGNSE